MTLPANNIGWFCGACGVRGRSHGPGLLELPGTLSRAAKRPKGAKDMNIYHSNYRVLWGARVRWPNSSLGFVMGTWPWRVGSGVGAS